MDTTARKLLPLRFETDGFWRTYPQLPFKPRGLAIWGTPPGAMLETALIGVDLQVVAAYGAVPARWFGQGDSYAQIAKLIEQGKEPPAWCTWDVVQPGMIVRLRIEASHGTPLGPDDGVEAVFWGETMRL